MNNIIYPVGFRLSPKVQEDGSLFTGFGVILKHKEVPLYMKVRPNYYVPEGSEWCLTRGDSVLYTVLTDFGNTFEVNYFDLNRFYEIGSVVDLSERLSNQMSNLLEVMKGL